MKKALMVFGAVSMSVLLSGCGDHMAHGNPPPPDQMAQNGGWHGPDAHREHMRMMNEYFFDQMDTNHDGEISMKEFMDFQHRMFREADTNHDGVLAMDEIKAQKMREMKKMHEWMEDHRDDMHGDGMHNDQVDRDTPMHDGDMNRDRY